MSVLIKQDGLYYSILPEFYDGNLGEYIPLESVDFTKAFNGDELFNGVLSDEYIDVAPKMTSNTTPSPYVASASSQYDTRFPPWRAFNKTNLNPDDCWITLNGVNTGWIQLDFNKQIIVNRVAITSRYSLTNVGETIKDFSIQGSNDGVTWNTIKSYSNEPIWTGNETRTYELDRVVNYRYYRINVAANFGYNYTTIGGIRFLYKPTVGYPKPIDKFDNFTLLTQNSELYNIEAIKSQTELVVANGDIPFYIAAKTNSFIPTFNIYENSQIKMILSIDGGITWLTHDGQDFTPISVSIPLKEYSDMTLGERALYDSNKTIILNDGFSIEDLSSIDFNTISGDNLRFAYAIYRQDYLSESECSKIEWDFDSIGSVMNVKRSEFICDVFSHGVNITSNVDSPLMMVNVFGSQILKENQGGEMPITDKITLDKPVLNVSDTGYMSWGLIDNAGLYKIYVNGNEVGETSDLQYQFDDMVDGELYVFVILAIPTDDENYNISPYSNSIVIDKR